MLRLIILAALGFIMFRLVKGLFPGLSDKNQVKGNPSPKEEDFQQKNKNRIEDADFEDLE